MSKERALRELWGVYDRGDHLTDSEVARLLESAEQGVNYLQARGERLAAKTTLIDISTLKSFQQARELL